MVLRDQVALPRLVACDGANNEAGLTPTPHPVGTTRNKVGEQTVNASSTWTDQLARAAKIALAVVAGLAVLAVPSVAATTAAQAEDNEVSPAVRSAVLYASLQRAVGGPVGARLADGVPLPGAPPISAISGPPTPLMPNAAVPPGPGRAAKKIVSQKQLLKLVKRHFPKDQIGNAMAVAECESGQRSIVGDTNPDGTTDWGVFQLNDAGTLQGSLRTIGVNFADTRAAQVAALDPVTNVKAAGAIYRDRGWAPWVCAYRQQIVASLYTNEPGPMYGRYDPVGGSLGPLAASDDALAESKQQAKAKAKAEAKAKAKAKAEAKAKAKAKEKAKADAKAKEKAKAPAKPAPSAPPSAGPGSGNDPVSNP